MSRKDIGYLIKNINDKLKARADADLKKYNLTLTQSRVCVFLNSCGGQATQKEIELFLEVSHPTVVGIVSRMEQNGYVTCWMDPNDKRNKNVTLTPQAKAIAMDMEQSVRSSENQLLASFTAKDTELLLQLLNKMLENLD